MLQIPLFSSENVFLFFNVLKAVADMAALDLHPEHGQQRSFDLVFDLSASWTKGKALDCNNICLEATHQYLPLFLFLLKGKEAFVIIVCCMQFQPLTIKVLMWCKTSYLPIIALLNMSVNYERVLWIMANTMQMHFNASS